MPGLNRKGPLGEGPGTGRGLGRCNNSGGQGTPSQQGRGYGWRQPNRRRPAGLGRGLSRGWGRGRGLGRRRTPGM